MPLDESRGASTKSAVAAREARARERERKRKAAAALKAETRATAAAAAPVVHPSHEYDVPKPTRAEAAATKTRQKAAARAEKHAKMVARLDAAQQAFDWGVQQTVTPAELNLFPARKPPKAKTWKQLKAQERKDFAALRKQVIAGLPEGYKLDEKAWKAYVAENTVRKPSVVWKGDPEDLFAPPPTPEQVAALAKEDRAARHKLAQGALVGDREEFVEDLSPAERRALIKGRRNLPPDRPWQPNLSPWAAHIPGASEAMQVSHWAEGLLGTEGAATKGVEAFPGLAWQARNKVRDIGVGLGADDPLFGVKGSWAVRNKAQDVGRALERGTEAAAKYVVSDTKEGFTPSQLAKDVRDVADIAKQTYNFIDPFNIGTVDEASLAVYRGVFDKAPTALLIWMQNQPWLTNATPAQKARNREELEHILMEGRGAEAARELVIGPALSQHMIDGGPISPMAMLELAMLVAPGIGFTPMRPAVAGTRAAIAGVRAIPQGGRHAVGEAAKEWNRIVPVRGLSLSSEAGGIRVGWLGGVKPEPAWRTPFSEQLGLKGVAAKSHFGRKVESLVLDPVRAATGRGKAYAAHQQKRSEGIQRKIVGWPGRTLERAARGMSLEESYAIRALASGVMPLERAAKHREWALASSDPMQMYAHGVHAELNEKAAKYVMEGPPNAKGAPTVILKPSAPGRLHQTWDYYQKAYAQRQDILVKMNELEQETIDNRLQASGKLFKGGQFVPEEDWVKLQLQTSAARGHIVEAVQKLVDVGRAKQEDIDLWMQVVDGQARSWASRETRKLRRRRSYLNKQIKRWEDDDDKVVEYLAQLEDVNEQLSSGIAPDSYFDDLDRVITGPGRALLPSIFGADHDTVSFFAALKHWSDETVDKRLASKLDPKKFHQGRTANPTIKRRGMTIGGKTTTKGWLQAVGKVMGREEILYWRTWYDNFGEAFKVFGEDAEAIMRGFAASQANQAPAGGITSVLKVMDRLRAGEEVTSEGIGMVAKAVSEAVQGTEVEKGVAAKLSDFSDALRGVKTRTWMGGRAEGGMPAPADVWAARDLGYIDKKHAKKLVKEFGLVEGVDFVVDSPGAPSGLRYERISEQYQEIAKHMNAMDDGKGYLGVNDWTPAQVQAVGWAKAQKMVGVDPEDLAFALQRNTRSIDFEITQGPLHLGGDLTPEQVHAVAEAMIPEMRRLIEDSPGIYFRDIKLGISGWSEGANGSIHIDVLGSERDIQNMLSRFARAFDQEYVQASREITRAGSKAALTIGSEAFADETVKVAFFKRLSEVAPEIPVLDKAGNRVKEGGKLVKESELQGYQPKDFPQADGNLLPGIAIRTARPYVSPKTARRFTDRFKAAITQVADEMGIDVEFGVRNIELLIGSQHGEATRFARAGSTGGISSLDDPLEAATRKRLTETLDSVRRGERPGGIDFHRYVPANRESELGVPHAVGDDLDDIIEYMGANDRPHLLDPLGVGKPPRVIDVHTPEGIPAWSQGHEWISTGKGMQAIVPGSERPPRWLYRAISEEEWTGIKESGYLQSDGRMNLGPGEGTVVSLDDPRFYLPGKLHSDAPGTYDGRIIRIKYRDEDGWILDPNDQYVKTQKPVPISSIDMVSPKLRGERGTRLTAGGQEVPTLPVFRPIARDAPDLLAYQPATRYRVLNEEGEVLYSVFSREEAEAAIEQLKKTYGAEWEYRIEEKEGIPDNRYFAPGEGAHDLVRTEEGDALVHKLVENHPELIKMLWEDDPQDWIVTEFGGEPPSLATIERAKDMVRDLTWEHLNEKYPDGEVTLYRGGSRPSESGLIPWTTNYGTALNTYAKGDPAKVRTRRVNVAEVEASISALQREVPGAWYKGFTNEDEMLLWGDDTTRRMAVRGRGMGSGHYSSYGTVTPTDPATIAASRAGKIPVAGAKVPTLPRHEFFIGPPVRPARGRHRSFIILSERHGSAYAVGHEFVHYLETQLTPHQLKTLEEGVGTHGEDIVMAWTTWALMGGGGKLGPIFQQLSDSIISDLAQLGISAANANAIPHHIIELLDTLHNWDELKGGAIRILDEEGLPSAITHTAGVAKEPFYPGMPVSLRNKLWDFFKYSRQQSMSISGRGPIGKQWSDPTVKKQLKGHLLKSGLFEADVIRGAMREYFKAMKLDATARVRGVLIQAARDLPNGGRKPSAATDYAIKINPDKTTSKELSKFFDLIADIDSGETLESALRKRGARGALTRRIKLNELEQTHEDAINGAIEQLYPRAFEEADGSLTDIKKVAAEMMDGKRGEIENILWVPRELVEKSGIFEPPWLQAAKRASASLPLKAATGGMEMINDAFRISLLLANPAYYPMNLIGNVVMNLIQQGPFALYNLPRAVVLSRTLGKDNAFFIDNLMGEGWIGAAEIKSGLLKGKASVGLTNVANLLVDRIPRRAAWLHEALRMNYRTGEELDNLIAAAQRGDAQAREHIEIITRAALDEMVDFDNLSAIERGFITRIIFVYPWLKGSTVWTKNFVLNHPVQAAAFAFLYERQQAMANNEIGERPDYLDLFFPFPSWFPGPDHVTRYGEEYPYGMSLRQMFTMSTTYDIFNAFYGYARGDIASSPLTEYFQPMYSAALASMTGYDPFLDKKVPRGILPLLEAVGRNLTVDSPLWNNLWDKVLAQDEEDRRRHAEEGRLYPRNRFDDILRLVFGSLAPGPVNPQTAGKRAREGTAAPVEDKVTEWSDEAKELTGSSPTIEIITYKTSHLRYDEIQGEIRREEGVSDLTDAQLTEAKMRTYLEVHPEDEDERVKWTGWIYADGANLKKWDDFFSTSLGWEKLNEYERYVKKYSDYAEKTGAAAKP